MEDLQKKSVPWFGLASVFSVFFIGLLVYSGIGHSPSSSVITVYTSVPLALSTGQNIANGVTLAFENTHFKVGNLKLNLQIVDDGNEKGAWLPEREQANAEAAAEDQSVLAYIGPFNSGAAKISMPLLNMAGIVQISPGNTWPGLTKTGFLPGEPGIFYPTGVRHYTRVTPTDDLQGPAGALWARELGYKTLYVVNDGEVYGSGIAALFSSRAKSIGLTIVGESSLENTPEKIQALVAELKKTKPDLVYFGGITPNGGPELLKEMRKSGLTSAFMGPDGILESDFISRSGEVSEGVHATTIGVSPEQLKNPEATAFRDAYEVRFGVEPEVFASFGFEAGNVILEAIRNTKNPTRQSILSAVRNTKDFRGIFGVWGFDENGDTTLRLVSGNTVSDGAFVFTKILGGSSQ